ncbi:MAG: hypothetical protein AB7O74_08640 [Candidatus Nanopelagicales bacterium]
MRAQLPAAVAVAVLLAACGTETAGTGGADQAPRSAGTVAAECPADLEPFTDYASGPRLPDDAAPVGVLRCVVEQEDDPATGRWTVVRTEKATTGIDAYVAALRLPDEPRPEGDYACTADALALPWLAVLLPDGRALQVALPLTPCGKPRSEVLAALDALDFSTVSTERVSQVSTPEQLGLEKQAAALGCAYQFKDMITIEAGDGPDSGKQRLLATTPNRMTSCRYSADPASDDPVLTFVGGGRALTPQEVDTAVAALQTATPTTEACPSPHTVVWGLYGADGGPWLLVELDGCGRVASDTGALRTLPAASLAELQAVLEATAG